MKTLNTYIKEGFFDNVGIDKEEIEKMTWEADQRKLAQRMKSSSFFKEESTNLPSELKKINDLADFYKKEHILARETTPDVISLYLVKSLEGTVYEKYFDHIWPGTFTYEKYFKDSYSERLRLPDRMYLNLGEMKDNYRCFSATTYMRVLKWCNKQDAELAGTKIYPEDEREKLEDDKEWFVIGCFTNSGKDRIDELVKVFEWLDIPYKIVYIGGSALRQTKITRRLLVRPFTKK